MSCERCGQSMKNLSSEDVQIGDEEWTVCSVCVEALTDEIESPLWYHRFEKKHYNAIGEYLRSIDKIWCVHDNCYDIGEMWIHSPYLNHALVNDVVSLMNIRVRHVSVVKPESYDGPHDCVYDHGPCVEYNLAYDRMSRPAPPSALDDVSHPDHEHVDEVDRIDKAGALAHYYWNQSNDGQ